MPSQNPPQEMNDKNNNNTRPKRILNLLLHIPTFLFRFFRLLTFVVVLTPAFCVFLWHYLTCDRVAVYYGDDYRCGCKETRRAESRHSNGTNEQYTNGHTTQRSKQCTKCRPFFSRHYLDIYGSSTPSPDPKPVLLFLTGGAYIIGYKMWGTLLARALSPHVLVIVPDYRNYPRVTIEGMVGDVDKSIEWVLRNAGQYGGDGERVAVVGQSAGAHLGGLVVVKKVLDKLRKLGKANDSLNASSNVHTPLKTTYEATQLCGFISTSSPHNLVTMRQVFHRHGLSSSVQKSIFGGVEADDLGDAIDSSGDDVFEKWSTFHLVKECHEEYLKLLGSTSDGTKAAIDFELKDLFPRLCVIHGTDDKTVPVEESIEFLSLLSNLQIPCESKFYEGWTHTDPILEAPMQGNHLYHKDVYELLRLWTEKSNSIASETNGNHNGMSSGSCCNGLSSNNGHDRQSTDKNGAVSDKSISLPELDETDPMLRTICPQALVKVARICNPF